MAEHGPSAHHPELIIVKRHEDDEHEPHSSAWKVAHADFMTAMMAFFLIMWLINVTDENIRKGISEYFNPMHLSQGQSEEKGLNDPHVADIEPDQKRGNALGGKEAAEAAKPADKAAASAKAGEGASAKASEKDKKKDKDKPAGATKEAAAKPAEGGGAPVADKSAQGAGEAQRREQAAFADPFVTLAGLRGEDRSLPASAAILSGGDSPSAGLAAGAADRDPFDPVFWQSGRAEAGRQAMAGANDKTVPKTEAGSGTPPTRNDPPATVAKPAEAPTADKTPPSPEALAEAKAASLRADLNAAVQAAGASSAPTVKVEATRDGLVVNLTDDADFSMFNVGSAIPNARAVRIMDEVGKTIARLNGDIVIRGFTDARPFRSDVYDNWRLSAARAQMAYYMLVRGGVEEKRVSAIEGHADRNPRNRTDSYAAENRRIEILIKDSAK